MKINNTVCPICSAKVNLQGRGGPLWLRGDIAFDSKGCYDSFDWISQEMTEIVDFLETHLQILRSELKHKRINGQIVRSYLSDLWEGESAKVVAAFFNQMEWDQAQRDN